MRAVVVTVGLILITIQETYVLFSNFSALLGVNHAGLERWGQLFAEVVNSYKNVLYFRKIH
jgi:hypothetical protein